MEKLFNDILVGGMLPVAALILIMFGVFIGWILFAMMKSDSKEEGEWIEVKTPFKLEVGERFRYNPETDKYYKWEG